MTAPLTPPDCDLRGLPFMPLDVVRLIDSDLAALSTGEEFKAAVTLWCKAWLQVPAASLPDDDRILAHLSGAGPRWKRVKDMALRGFVLCSDGRWYHSVIAEKAAEAWAFRLKQRSKAKGRWDKPKGGSADAAGQAAGDAAALPLNMQGTGTGTDSSVSNETGASAPIDPDKKAWQEGVSLLKSHGLDEKQARAFVGKLVRDIGGEARALLPIFARCIEIGSQDPQAYLRKAVQAHAGRRAGGSAPPPPQTPDDDAHLWPRRVEGWKRDRTWIVSMWGPAPGEPGCQCPAELLEAA
jgi:hypothetical protein